MTCRLQDSLTYNVAFFLNQSTEYKEENFILWIEVLFYKFIIKFKIKILKFILMNWKQVYFALIVLCSFPELLYSQNNNSKSYSTLNILNNLIKSPTNNINSNKKNWKNRKNRITTKDLCKFTIGIKKIPSNLVRLVKTHVT